VLSTFTFSPKNPYQAKQTFQLQGVWSSNAQQKGPVSEEVTRYNCLTRLGLSYGKRRDRATALYHNRVGRVVVIPRWLP
jgi:hypothetical protein